MSQTGNEVPWVLAAKTGKIGFANRLGRGDRVPDSDWGVGRRENAHQFLGPGDDWAAGRSRLGRQLEYRHGHLAAVSRQLQVAVLPDAAGGVREDKLQPGRMADSPHFGTDTGFALREGQRGRVFRHPVQLDHGEVAGRISGDDGAGRPVAGQVQRHRIAVGVSVADGFTIGGYGKRHPDPILSADAIVR